MFFIIVAVKIGIYTKYRAEKISWTLGDTCASKNNLTIEANGFDATECALAIGHAYTLKCKSSVGQGWNSTVIIIENVAYCEKELTPRVVFDNRTIIIDNDRLENPKFTEVASENMVKPMETRIEESSNILFVRGITADVDEQILYELFQNAGRESQNLL